MIRATILAAMIATPALADGGMPCTEFLRILDMDFPAHAAFDNDALLGFATEYGAQQGIMLGIEIARPDLEGLSERVPQACRDDLNADAYEIIKKELAGPQ